MPLVGANDYRLFMAYTKLKQQRQDYDAADRTHWILKEFRDVGVPGRKVDYLYVYEVLDNLLIDTLLLRTICANQHGLFWAGDAIQTMPIGGSILFHDLKAYQYRIEKQLSYESGFTPVEPKTFELVVNYRSHGGIVNCARSVVELIMRYWPHSIDAVKPERASIDGCMPIFFDGQGNADFETLLFGNGRGEPIEFGAEKCILVRNDAAKDRLRQRLGDCSIIMTLCESKGLQFNDVLLYNFFEDSPATIGQWRLVLNGVSDENGFSDAPTFDEMHHASICTELKLLYHGITRARNKLWIVDGSVSGGPMKVYWSSKNRIQIWSSTSEVPRFATSTTSEEWSKTGKTMFLNKRYAQASAAFIKAGRSREVAICNAYLLREKARSIPTTASTTRIQAFIIAANAFAALARDSPSKRVNERLAYYKASGECYSEARDLKSAGDSYRMAEQYAAAASTYREGGYSDELVEVIKRLNIREAGNLFSSDEDALKFFEDHGLDEARAEMLKESARGREQEIGGRTNNSETARPAKAYRSSKTETETRPPTTKIPRSVASSTSRESLITGRTMFFYKHYAKASAAFIKAGENQDAAICDAYLLREKALSIPAATSTARIQAFITAANAFIVCARDTPYEEADERLSYHEAAGECYLEARDLKNAGDSYLMANQYAIAAHAYRKGGYFNELVDMIARHRNDLDSGLLERLTKVVQLHRYECLDVRTTVRDSAAKKIQAAYRRHSRQKSIFRTEIDATKARYWHHLREMSVEMEWPDDSRYYLLFRVPLAYILVCLDMIRTFVESEKKKEAEKWMATEDRGDLEGLMESLQQHNELLKETIALQKKLSPSSGFHEGQSVTALQRAVLDVKIVVESLDDIPGSVVVRNQIEKCWNGGWKWIFEK